MPARPGDARADRLPPAWRRRTGWLLLALQAAGFPFPPPSALATPYDGKVFISGIVDADPSDQPDSDLRNLTYKAIEFYSEVPIAPAEYPKFALRVYNDSRSETFSPLSDIAFSAGPGVSADSRFYMATLGASFSQLYDNPSVIPDWNARNVGPANLVYEGLGLINYNGNEVYQLVYYPNGIGGALPAEVLDTYGVIDYPGSPSFTPPPSFSYDNSWAYRVNMTRGGGTAFNPADWIIPGANALANLTLAQATAAVPFGTYQAVPEASTLPLSIAGMALLLWLRRNAQVHAGSRPRSPPGPGAGIFPG